MLFHVNHLPINIVYRRTSQKLYLHLHVSKYRHNFYQQKVQPVLRLYARQLFQNTCPWELYIWQKSQFKSLLWLFCLQIDRIVPKKWQTFWQGTGTKMVWSSLHVAHSHTIHIMKDIQTNITYRWTLRRWQWN
jgi:hypothetical protein